MQSAQFNPTIPTPNVAHYADSNRVDPRHCPPYMVASGNSSCASDNESARRWADLDFDGELSSATGRWADQEFDEDHDEDQSTGAPSDDPHMFVTDDELQHRPRHGHPKRTQPRGLPASGVQGPLSPVTAFEQICMGGAGVPSSRGRSSTLSDHSTQGESTEAPLLDVAQEVTIMGNESVEEMITKFELLNKLTNEKTTCLRSVTQSTACLLSMANKRKAQLMERNKMLHDVANRRRVELILQNQLITHAIQSGQGNSNVTRQGAALPETPAPLSQVTTPPLRHQNMPSITSQLDMNLMAARGGGDAGTGAALVSEPHGAVAAPTRRNIRWEACD